MLWESFYAVAKWGSFAEAARRLSTQTSQVTKRVQTLEDQLQIRLFQRTTRRVSPTPEGLELMGEVQELLRISHGLSQRSETKTALVGKVRIAVLTSFANSSLVPKLPIFLKSHPEIKLELIISDHVIDLIDHQIDVAIRVETPKNKEMVYRPICENKIVLCASPEYLRQHNALKLSKPSDLLLHSVYTLHNYRNLKFLSTSQKLSACIRPAPIECNNGTTLTAMGVAGLGIIVRSLYDVENYFASGKLIRLLPHHPLESFRQVYAVTPYFQKIPPRVRAFLDFLQAVYPAAS